MFIRAIAMMCAVLGLGATSIVFSDGFESQTGRWQISAPNCSGTGTATVDDTVAHTGSASLRISGGAGYCNHVFADDLTDMRAASPTWFVRFWINHTTPLPTGHVTFLAMNNAADNNTALRLGAQNGALMWNRQSDDATLPDESPAGVADSFVLPTNRWTCVEFGVDGSGDLDTWVNGTAVPGLTENGVAAPGITDQWLARGNWRPNLTDLGLGWESYADQTDTLWFDDVALGTSRIGCT
ncbi:MAG TPA: hypothetical protein VJ914_19320 [Pseudonocardiaceae bacterium]|nr:hypothetical protein [Pseudonocardiaceae bacterium]